MSTRPAKSQLEIDFLPPFGVPEVNMKGAAAFVGGLAIAGAVALSRIQNDDDY